MWKILVILIVMNFFFRFLDVILILHFENFLSHLLTFFLVCMNYVVQKDPLHDSYVTYSLISLRLCSDFLNRISLKSVITQQNADLKHLHQNNCVNLQTNCYFSSNHMTLNWHRLNISVKRSEMVCWNFWFSNSQRFQCLYSPHEVYTKSSLVRCSFWSISSFASLLPLIFFTVLHWPLKNIAKNVCKWRDIPMWRCCNILIIHCCPCFSC